MWSAMRLYSQSSVRSTLQRGVISMPSSFSTASAYAKPLLSAEQ